MNLKELTELYNFNGKTAIVTGGTGVLGSEIAAVLLGCGAKVAIIDLNTKLTAELKIKFSGLTEGLVVLEGDVLDQNSMQEVLKKISRSIGKIDILVNAAGGNHPQATTSPDLSFFDIPIEAIRKVLGLNLEGTIIPSQVIGKHFADQNKGVILNVSSMNAFKPLTRIPAYSAAKAAVSNFTQWLAVHMAQEYSTNIRVNAIAPGFFLTEQNRFLLTAKETGDLTKRGKQIIDHTPLGKFGNPGDLVGAVLWLLSPASAFVTGIVLPIDGGFSAYSGV